MGNRAVITTKKKDLALYLHWNGGRDTVEPIVTSCAASGIPSPEKDPSGWALLTQKFCNFMGGNMSVGLAPYEQLGASQGDNGVYVIDDWKIAERINPPWEEQAEYDPEDILEHVESRTPRIEYATPKEEDKHVVVTTPYPLFDRKVCVEIASESPYLDLAAMCDWLEKTGCRAPTQDSYGWARLVQTATNLLGPEKVRIGMPAELIDENLNLDSEESVLAFDERPRYGRKPSGWNLSDEWGWRPNALDEYYVLHPQEKRELLRDVDRCMPEADRLGDDYIDGWNKRVQDLAIGDVIAIPGYASMDRRTVVGFGDGRICNGIDTLGLPIISRIVDKDGKVRLDNPNNYLRCDEVRFVGEDPTVEDYGYTYDQLKERAEGISHNPSTLDELTELAGSSIAIGAEQRVPNITEEKGI